jgi:hypothetical protein
MPEPSSTRPDYELLLHSGIQAARRGQRATARALFLAITREHPSAVRAWLALAGVAEGREEQRAALEQALLLEPTNTLARQALERLDRLASDAQATAPAVQAAPSPPSADERDDLSDLDSRLASGPQVALPYAEQADEEPAAEPAYLRRIPGWLVIAALAAAIGLALGYFLLPGFGSQPPTASPPTPPLVLLPTAAGVAEPTPAPAQTSSATALPPQPTSEPTSLLPTPRPVLEPTLAPAAPLAMGTLQEYDSWSATLLRPDYALALDGSIGDLQPSGRFVFALLSVSNGGATARRLPPDIFSLVDQQGRRYSPVGGASTAYLALFGRGQYGDLAFEDEVAAGGSLFSVPVIFDVPPDATGLILTVGRDASAGWQVQEGSASTQSPNIGP